MFNLILTNGKEDTSIPFKVRNTSIAKKWYKELLKNYKLYEIDRFTNWGTHNLIDELNDCIDEMKRAEFILIDISVLIVLVCNKI